MSQPLRIGLAACFFHADPTRPIFKGKTLLYLEESMSHWLMAGGAMPMLLPTPSGDIDSDALAASIDGLVLQGGSDLSPSSYGEQPGRPEWTGDRVRDKYEKALIESCLALDRPILGICRGLQMINVALGGTLYQDIVGQHPGAQKHRDWEQYDGLQHDIAIEPDSELSRWYGTTKARVNSVHHQGIKELAPDLRVEARSVPDGVIEAVRYRKDPFVYAVQWHPEFQKPAESLLPTEPLRDHFLEAVASRRRLREAAAAPC